MAGRRIQDLSPAESLIFRITHVQNVPWMLDHGLHCQNGPVRDPNFTPIGLADLISKRARHPITKGPGGTLADYVPFYFTPASIMLLYIKTGFNGRVVKRPNNEIAVVVSSLRRLSTAGTRFLLTNGNAYAAETETFEDMADVDQIDWPLLRRKDFKRDPEDPGKQNRYQAEALAHRHVPIGALLGLACLGQATRLTLKSEVSGRGLRLPVAERPDWYF